MLSLAISAPSCTPTKLALTSWEHATEPVCGPFGVVATALVLVVLFTSTWPPTPRTQTPPPCWSGAGLPGALMKAVLWSKKAVLAVVIAELIMLEMEAGDEPTDPRFPIFDGLNIEQFCACAPVAANNETAAAMPTSSPVRNFP